MVNQHIAAEDWEEDLLLSYSSIFFLSQLEQQVHESKVGVID